MAAAQCSPLALEAGLLALEALLPGMQPNLDALPAAQWALLVLDVPGVAQRVIALKSGWPGLDLSRFLTQYPRALTLSCDQILQDAAQVRELLRSATNPDAILQEVPVLMVPMTCASVLASIVKWYPKAEDPVAVLEKDPDLVRRAQEWGAIFDPPIKGKDGKWVIANRDMGKRTEWQLWIDKRAGKELP